MVREFGFSLIEILITIAILAVLAVLSVFVLAPFRRAVKTDDAAGVLYTLVRQARLQAITRREFYAVVINSAGSDQTFQLNNSTKNLKFLARSVSLVDMGRITVQNDEEITLTRQLPSDVVLNASTGLPPTTALPLPERNFSVHNFGASVPSGTFVCYLNPAGRAVTTADGAGTQVYKVFSFSAGDITIAKSATLLRTVTLYGATGGMKYWKYSPSLNMWVS